MEPYQLLLMVAKVCEENGIRYFITGSMAAMTYGEHRFTNDIDVVIDFRYRDIEPFRAAFPAPAFYLSREAMTDAIRQAPSQFNILLPEHGLKVDVMVSDLSSFDESRFDRVVKDPQANGQIVRFSSPEDVILKKLVYYEEGGSEKHVRDIGSILRVQGDKIDRAYIEKWAQRLNVLDAWRMIRDKVAQAELDFGRGH